MAPVLQELKCGIIVAHVNGKQCQPMTLFGTCSFFVHVELVSLWNPRAFVSDDVHV
jgi:hypothetical protein